MNVALCPLRMKVVSAKAASPSGAGSATGKGSTGAARTSSATTAMRASSIRARPRAGERAGAGAIEPGLDRDDVPGEELVADPPERRLLVHLEADPVPEAVVEALGQHASLLLRAQGRIAVALEDLAGELEEVLAGRSGTDFGDRPVERLLHEPGVLDELVGRRADDGGARHVGVAAGRAVARGEVEDDRLVGRDRAGAEVVADGGLRAVRDDRILRGDAVGAEDALHRDLEPLARERLALEAEDAVRAVGAPQQRARLVHRRLP